MTTHETTTVTREHAPVDACPVCAAATIELATLPIFDAEAKAVRYVTRADCANGCRLSVAQQHAIFGANVAAGYRSLA